ncbi:TIGR02281 family clan AA aspartic protease [Wolbachia endosymbiont of Pentidionis agamae]|uniref:TIGR02281 family clan AA aspartic protease n=1 Tax=Wolbachia endosymbiont of Pentidionis agamae TaxID=3110435 RepID=UPI002FD17ED7
MNSIKNLIFWFLIIIITAMLYDANKEKLNDIFISTFLPYRGRVQGSGQIEFTKSYDGHFYVQAQINNRSVRFLLDTGATDITLSYPDAIKVGINTENIQNFKIYETAKGKIKAGVVNIPEMGIGNFVIKNIQVSINTHEMSHSLLGMNLLKHFNFTIKNDRLIIYRNP